MELTRFFRRTQTTAYLDFFCQSSHKVRPVDDTPNVVISKDRKLAIAVSNQTLLPELWIKRGGIGSLAIRCINFFTDTELAFPPGKKTTLNELENEEERENIMRE